MATDKRSLTLDIDGRGRSLVTRNQVAVSAVSACSTLLSLTAGRTSLSVVSSDWLLGSRVSLLPHAHATAARVTVGVTYQMPRQVNCLPGHKKKQNTDATGCPP